jgi:4-carboxymuconolactone decarboxylase
MSTKAGGRAEDGRRIWERALGDNTAEVLETIAAWEPALVEWIDDFSYGTVWNRPGLGFEERQLVAIVALAAQGNTVQIRNYLHGALQDGMSPRAIHEALLMLCVYCGFPTLLGVLPIWREVLDAHKGAAMSPGTGTREPGVH